MASIAVLNYSVNPYDVYDVPRVAGWSLKKPKALNHILLAKQRQAERIRPRTILLGNSRVYIGLDPESPVWPASARPVYNFAIPGDDLSEVFRNLVDASGGGMLNSAVVGLDFVDFVFPRACELPPEPDRGDLQGRVGGLVQTLLSLQALVDAGQTLLAQRNAHAANLTSSGFGPMNEFGDLAYWGGHGTLFWRKNLEYVRNFGDLRMTGATQCDSYSWQIGLLERLLKVAHSENIRTHLFIHPYHADLLEILTQAGYWDRFEAWKRQLTALVAEKASSGHQVELWDFSGYFGPTSELVPKAGALTEMEWYWETSHYKPGLGDRIVSRVLNGSSDFGTRLTPNTIEDHVLSVRASQSHYRSVRASEVARIRHLFDHRPETRREAGPRVN